MIKLLTIIGARPQFIKAAAISRAIRTHYQDQIEEVIVHTGQHYDPNLSEVFFSELKIPREKYNLNVGSGGHAAQTAKMMIEIDQVVAKEKPDAILLFGDTNSTLAACLVGIKLHLPIIHVEGGVRSYNKAFPEEVNRLVCDHMSSLIFVPSDAGMEGLKNEGFTLKNDPLQKASADYPQVFRCGDVMYDNTLYFLEKADRPGSMVEKYNLPKDNYLLATMHRPSNVDQPETLESILRAFNTLIEEHGKTIVIPLHPRTQNKLEQWPHLKPLLENEKLIVLPPASFLDMIQLEKGADLVMTDSGGVQKEAYFVKKPCLIMLEETPWVELVASKNALLVGSDYQKIVDGAAHFLNNATTLEYPELYGDGKSSEFICEKIIQQL